MSMMNLVYGAVAGSGVTLLALFTYAHLRGDAPENAEQLNNDPHRLAVTTRWLRENSLLYVVNKWLDTNGYLIGKKAIQERDLLDFENKHGARCTECSSLYQSGDGDFECRNPDCHASSTTRGNGGPGAEQRQGQFQQGGEPTGQNDTGRRGSSQGQFDSGGRGQEHVAGNDQTRSGQQSPNHGHGQGGSDGRGGHGHSRGRDDRSGNQF